MRFTLKHLLLAIVLVSVALGLLRAVSVADVGEHHGRVSWLPECATNVSYIRSYSFTAYEFDMPEDEFLGWAVRWKVQPVSTPSKIRRYTTMSSRLPPLSSDSSLDDWRDRAVQEVTISDGFFYESRSGSRGGVCVGYDRTRGRVYFQANPR
jgi:hypothetical protein